MGLREGSIFLIVLTTSLVYTDARISVVSDTIEQRVTGSKNKIQAAVGRNQQLCTLCEEYTALAAGYLRANKTETEIIDTLHKTCSRLHSYEQQCLVLVDYYAPLFLRRLRRYSRRNFAHGLIYVRRGCRFLF
ncbi:proactivator polypeptide-like 1 [Iris pallida]|uniref:Proactivator polypeptide-like 1 n=1 Tax=Iris pallida TaxID=29817 RepID=A0AAX6EQT2_IRIPA|nr:proactivator polypeptide-like 1 [Iris pallida]